jgi:hypothetical protein
MSFLEKKNILPEFTFSGPISIRSMYLCLLPSSAIVKMDNGENMGNVR